MPAAANDGDERDQSPALNRAHKRVRDRSAVCGTAPMVNVTSHFFSGRNTDKSAIIGRLAHRRWDNA